MTYLSVPAAFRTASRDRQSLLPRSRRRGFWRALIDAVMGAHQRDAQRDIDRFVARSGGKMTDSLEREIGECIRRHTWNVGP